jgi:MFS transporter, DHA1 family, multidrug resistance protein
MTQPPRPAATSGLGHSIGWLTLLAALTSIGPISIDLYLPSFSRIKAELGDGIENTLAAYMFGVAIGQLVYGPMSDRFGRKPPLYVALTLYVLGSLGCAWASSMQALIANRFLQALGGCAGVVIARAIVRDKCEAHEAARVFSTLILITAVGPIVAPLLGSGLSAAMGWRWLFFVQAALGALLLMMVHIYLSDDASRGERLRLRSVLATYQDLLCQRSFIGHALIGACTMGMIFCYIASAPTVLMKSYGLSAVQLALVMGLNSLCFVIASQFNLRRLRHHTPAWLLRRAVWIPVTLAATTLWVHWHYPDTLWLLVLLQLGIFVGAGHIAPNATAEAMAEQGQRAGAASSLLGSIQSLSSTLAGAAMGFFSSGGVHAMAMLMLLGALAMLLAQRWVGRLAEV